jgi:benzoyl-CoA reductase/2-hydroxyglutaryl-CoA dehydratase subunit BcrC/BadD/HgdB
MNQIEKIGITALVPPELLYGCRTIPCDLNNFVPSSKMDPKSKLCAWTATWREMILSNQLSIDALVVIAGGDCHNALVDGEKVALNGTPTFFFFYPFDNDIDYLGSQLTKLTEFLGGLQNPEMFNKISQLKELGIELDRKRVDGKLKASTIFPTLISFSDMKGNPEQFENEIIEMNKVVDDVNEHEFAGRVALIGVPPIFPDFHQVAESYGLQIVYDELPYEFIRLGGNSLDELARNYVDYTFARNIEFRLEFLQKQFETRKIDGIIHYTQYACHHLLEDDIFRQKFDYPILTIQGDLPCNTPGQVRTRLDAFSEMLQDL